MRTASVMRAVASSAGSPAACSTARTFSITVIHGKMANPWKTIATPGAMPTSGAPRTRTAPLVGWMRPARIRRMVDLPQPEGPSSATTSPSRISTDTSFRTSSRWPEGRTKV
jgi:hypothetical protein